MCARFGQDSSSGTAQRPSRTIQRNKMATTRVLSVLWRWRLTPATAPVDALAAIRLAVCHSGTNQNRYTITIFSLFPLVFLLVPLLFFLFEYLNIHIPIVNRVPLAVWASANAPQPPPPPRTAHSSETIVYDVCRRRGPYAQSFNGIMVKYVFNIIVENDRLSAIRFSSKNKYLL